MVAAVSFQIRDQARAAISVDRLSDLDHHQHGDAILRGQIDQERSLKMLLPLCVPYLVSIFSSVSTTRHMHKQSSEQS